MPKPIKTLLFFILLLSALFSFGQNYKELLIQSKQLLEDGKFEQSLAILNKIKNKEILETTTVNLYKTHLQNILNRNFSKKTRLEDSIYKIHIKTNYIDVQGVYNAKSKAYIIKPVYDSIIKYRDYFTANKKKETWLLKNDGKVILPLGQNRFSPIYNNAGEEKFFIAFYPGYGYLGSIYNYDGELIYENLNLSNFNKIQIPNHILNRLGNGKIQILDLENRKIVMDSLNDFTDNSFYHYNNEIISPNVKSNPQQSTLIKSKEGNFLAHNIDNKIVKTTEFDTFVDDFGNFSDNHSLNNSISKLINFKKNITLNENQYPDYDTYIIVKKNDKFGIYNISRNKFYKEPIYDSISKNGNTFYEGKWTNLVVGKEIVRSIFDYQRVIFFRENHKIGLMDFAGNVLLKPEYDEILTSYFLRKGKKWGYFNLQKKTIIIEPKYDYIVWNNNHLDAYLNRKITKYTFEGWPVPKSAPKTVSDKEYLSFDYGFSSENQQTNRKLFRRGKLYGFDDSLENEIVPALYTSINVAQNNTFIVTQNDTLQGLIDSTGKILIPLEYKQISESYFSDHLMVRNQNGLMGIFNYEGRNEYPFVINSFIDHRLVEKATYAIMNEEIDTKPVSYSINNKPMKMYGQALLKIEKDKVTKIGFRGYSFYFLKNDYVYFTNANGKNSSGFYNLKTDKYIEIPNKGYFEMEKDKAIFIKKDLKYDTVIDSTFNISALSRPFDMYKNGYFFFTSDGKTSVMNEQLQTAGFQYAFLQPFYEFRSSSSYFSPDFAAKVSPLFKFNVNPASKKHGVIGFDGKIIAQPENYDQVSFYYSGSNENWASRTNPHFKKYSDQLFIGTNTKKNNIEITLFTSAIPKLARFSIGQNESWNLGQFNNSIIIKGRDSVSIYSIPNQKTILKIKSGRFEERDDGSYSNIFYVSKGYDITIYDVNGKILEKKSFEKTAESSPGYASYIVKENGRYGTINSESKKTIPTVYDELKSIYNLKFIAKKNNKQGIIDASGLILLDIEYDSIENNPAVENDPNLSNISYNMLKVKKGKQTGILNATNFETILPTAFDHIKIHHYGFIAQKDSIWSAYTISGDLYFKFAVDSIITANYGSLRLYKEGREVFVNQKGRLTNENPNQEEDWVKKLKMKYCIEKEGKYYLANKNQVIHQVPIDKIFGVGIHDTENDKSIGFYILIDEKGKSGFIDEEQNLILPFEYDEIIPSKTLDYLMVKKEGRFGAVNYKNESVIPFKFDKISYNDWSRVFDCQIGKVFYRINPQNIILFKGTEKELHKDKKVTEIIFPD